MRRRTLQSPKYLKKRRQRAVLTVVSGLIAIISLLAVFVYLTKIDLMQVKAVTVVGNKSISSEDVIADSEKILGGYYLGIIPRSNIFFYPRKEIISNLISLYPRLAEVSASRYERIVTITIVERSPVATVCGKALDQCLFIDDTGYVFANNPSLTSGIYRTFNIEDGASLPKIGDVFIEPILLGKILKFADGLSRFELIAKTITVRADKDIFIETEINTDIYIRSTDSFDTTLHNLTLFLEESRSRARIKKTPVVFSQIDLRYGNAVYYKVPSEESTQSVVY